MKHLLSRIVVVAIVIAFAGEALAVEWNVSLWGKRRAFTEHIEKLAELVAKKTNGEFTLKLSYGGLSKNNKNLDGIFIGAFEMAQFCAGYHRDKNPSITVLELPFLGISSLAEERRISQAVYRHPAVQADIARWNATLLMPSPLPQYNLIGVGAEPFTLADYQGLAVRTTGGIGKALAAVGANPVFTTASEVLQALESGAVKAVAFAPHAHMSFGTTKSGKWWTTNLNPGTVNCPVVANTDALNKLSKTHRKALLGSIDNALDYYIATYNGKTMAEWHSVLRQKDIKSITYDDAELDALRAAVAQPAAVAWITENTARGLPAQELYDLVIGLVGQ